MIEHHIEQNIGERQLDEPKMIIQKCASWVMNYKEKSLGEINGTSTPNLDIRLNEIIQLRDEVNKQIQREIDYIYMVVQNRNNRVE